MSYTVPIVGLVVVVGLAGALYTTRNTDEFSPLSSGIDKPSVQPSVAALNDIGSNKELDSNSVNTADTIEDELQQLDVAAIQAQPAQASSASVQTTEAISFAQSIARERMDDVTINEHAEVLRQDPAKLSAVLQEFAAEIDATRLSQLRLLLGQLDDPSLVNVAESMLFSGNAESSYEALKLLRDIGSKVPAAQEVGVNVLSSTQDPQLLVGATNILNSSGSADADTRERVVTSLSSLVQHPDATVRRASYSTLARWSKDPSNTPILLQGLNDSDPNVRKSTAYGLVGYRHADASVINALLNTAENTSETRRARSGAMLALKGMSLDNSQAARLEAVQAQF